MDCNYCTGNVDSRKALLVTESLDEIYIDGENYLTGDDEFSLKEDTKINYCPMCGRKL